MSRGGWRTRSGSGCGLICRELKPETGGRHRPHGRGGGRREAIDRDLRFLQRVWAGSERRAWRLTAPALVYAEAELAMRSRARPAARSSAVLVDDEKLHRRLVSYLRAVAPELADRVELLQGELPLFERFGLEQEIKKALARRVGLPPAATSSSTTPRP